jgi:hypothetical protein
MPPAGLIIERLELHMTAEFEQVVRIYTEALPESERKSPSVLREMLAKPAYEFLIAKHNGAVVGFSTTAALSGTNACVLEYMAVRSRNRSQGIGAVLFQRAVSTTLAAPRYVLLEVDSEGIDAGERDQRARRQRFYRDLGCRRVSGLSYALPLVTANTPPPMDLLVYRSDLPPVIDKGQLREWLTALYVDIYGQPRDDARIPDMLRLLPDEVRLV